MQHVFEIWPTMAEMAKDLQKPYQTVASWKARNSIPADYDLDVVDAAQNRGFNLSLESLARARKERGAA